MTQEVTDVFEKGIRAKVRFQTIRGLISIEDLYDLPLTSENRDQVTLKQVNGILRSQVNTERDELFSEQSKVDEILDLKLEIVRRVVITKQNEEKERRNAAENRVLKEQLMRIRENKQQQELFDKPIEEIDAMIAKL